MGNFHSTGGHFRAAVDGAFVLVLKDFTITSAISALEMEHVKGVSGRVALPAIGGAFSFLGFARGHFLCRSAGLGWGGSRASGRTSRFGGSRSDGRVVGSSWNENAFRIKRSWRAESNWILGILGRSIQAIGIVRSLIAIHRLGGWSCDRRNLGWRSSGWRSSRWWSSCRRNPGRRKWGRCWAAGIVRSWLANVRRDWWRRWRLQSRCRRRDVWWQCDFRLSWNKAPRIIAAEFAFRFASSWNGIVDLLVRRQRRQVIQRWR